MLLPEYEMKSRLKKVQDLLVTKDLPGTLVYYDELNIANGWYLSGWCPQFESGCLFIPRQGEPMILGGPESEPFAKTDSAIKKTKNIPVFMVPEEEYPNATISSFAEVFDEIGIKGKSQKLGVVGLDKMPFGVYQLLKKIYWELTWLISLLNMNNFGRLNHPGNKNRSEKPLLLPTNLFR